MSASRRKPQKPHRSLMPRRPIITREELILRNKRARWAAILNECYLQRKRVEALLLNTSSKPTLEASPDRMKESLVRVEQQQDAGNDVPPPAHHPSPLSGEEQILVIGEVVEEKAVAAAGTS
jgi:hypothetical protein